jgi:RHS repeat-associated protein
VQAEPGQSVDVWFFDGSPMGGSGEWKVAGQGIVSADGTKVSMPPGTGIPRFCGVCGLMCLGKQPPAPNPPPGPPPPCDGNPVDLSQGQEMPKSRGMSCGGLTPIDAGMSYNPVDAFNGIAGTSGSIGLGWTLDYDIAFLPFDGPQKRLILPGNNRVNFIDSGAGIYRVENDPRFDGATIRATNAAANIWELKFKDGRIWRFRPYPGITGFIRGGPPTFVNEIVDAQGNTLGVNRQTEGKIVSIGTADRNISFTYGSNGFASEMRDTAGRVMRFAYNAKNRLSGVTDPDGKATSYTYVDDSEFVAPGVCGAQTSFGERLKTISYPGRPNPTTNDYGPGRRVLRQVGYDGREFRFSYRVTGACVTHVSNPNTLCTGVGCPDVDSWENLQAGWRIHGGNVVSTSVLKPDGQTYSNEFNSDGVATAATDPQGQKTYTKFDAKSRPIETTDALGRTTRFSYDANGNVTQVIDALGRVTRSTYDPVWNKPTSVTRFDDSNQPVTWSFTYHPQNGKLASSTNPLNQTSSLTYTGRGELETATNALGKTTRFEYDLVGDLVKIIDPLTHQARMGYDGAGRRTSVTDPLNFVTRTSYNGVDNITRITDALAKNTDMGYDPAGRLQNVTNARGHAVVSYGYESGDRLASRTDALSKAATFQYDSAGRLSRMTDRKGAATTFGYDGQGRVITIARPDEQTRFAYDIVGRTVSVADGAGTILFSYDGADRLTTEKQTAGGITTTIQYQYDALDRRVSRTVSGAVNETTTYGYDRTDRLTLITYRGQQTTFEYDAADRLSRKILPNGIVQTIVFDDADRVTEIKYANPDGSAIETMGYVYDEGGRRTSVTRAMAPAPETPFTAIYNAADRMTSITLTATGKTFNLGYDDNGNLTSRVEQGNASNLTTYVWDSQDRLASISGPGINASFQYDAIGRRVSRTVNGNATRYIYDGAQAMAEIRAGGTDSLLTSLGADEVIARYNVAGARVYLTDALNSVFAQAREDRTILNSYAYSAYGESAVSGPDEGNDIQYTARENDQTGLMFYRSRFYDPVLKRFIAEDTIGLAAGPNFYAYVDGNPVQKSDPTGTTPWGLIFAAGDLGWQLYQNGGDLGCVDWVSVGLSALGGGLLNGLAKGAFRFKTAGSHTWDATRSWMNREGIMPTAANQQRHHWLFERNQGIGRYVPDSIKNQPWNVNPVGSEFNNWMGQSAWRAPLGAPSWAAETAGGAAAAAAGGSGGGGGGGGGGSGCPCKK